MNFYIIRHGQSEGNVSGNIYGGTDYPLTPLGQEQAEAIREHFKAIDLEAVYTSPLRRAKDIGAMIAENKNLELVIDDRLREMDFGIFEDVPLQEVKDQIGFDGYVEMINPLTDYTPEAGIPHELFRQQIYDFMDEIATKYGATDKNVAITCHLGIIRVMLQKALQFDANMVRSYKTSPGSIIRLQFKQGAMFKLVALIQTMED